jgi:hypothetical protein
VPLAFRDEKVPGYRDHRREHPRVADAPRHNLLFDHPSPSWNVVVHRLSIETPQGWSNHPCDPGTDIVGLSEPVRLAALPCHFERVRRVEKSRPTARLAQGRLRESHCPTGPLRPRYLRRDSSTPARTPSCGFATVGTNGMTNPSERNGHTVRPSVLARN